MKLQVNPLGNIDSCFKVIVREYEVFKMEWSVSGKNSQLLKEGVLRTGHDCHRTGPVSLQPHQCRSQHLNSHSLQIALGLLCTYLSAIRTGSSRSVTVSHILGRHTKVHTHTYTHIIVIPEARLFRVNSLLKQYIWKFNMLLMFQENSEILKKKTKQDSKYIQTSHPACSCCHP